MNVLYLAGPFRGPTAWDIAENIRAAERLGLDIARLGAMPLIPQANTQHFHGSLPDEFWIDGTIELLRRCDGIVLLSSWERSIGARGELAEAQRLSLPVFYPGTGQLGAIRDWLAQQSRRKTDPNAVTITPPRNEQVTLPDVRELLATVTADETFGVMGGFDPAEG